MPTCRLRRHGGHAGAHPDRGRQGLRGGFRAAEPNRRPDGLQAQRGRHGHDAERLQGGLRRLPRRRLDGSRGAGGIWRAGAALHALGRDERIRLRGQHGARHVSRTHHGRGRRPAGARIGGAKADVPTAHGDRRLDRHDEPDGAALRHRPRLLKTKAVPNGDGSYAISGTKIFISAGEHDMADNIVHLVLARIEGARRREPRASRSSWCRSSW